MKIKRKFTFIFKMANNKRSLPYISIPFKIIYYYF